MEYPLPSRELACREIGMDPACGRLGADDREQLGFACWDFGRAAATSLLPDAGAPLETVIRRSGVRIETDDAGLGAGGGFVSEYRTPEATIVLHRAALTGWAVASGRPLPELVGIALAHEFFHHLDCVGVVDLRPVAGIRRASVWRRTSRLVVPRGAVEACAHGFASMAATHFDADAG
jgi:hypothetical protein